MKDKAEPCETRALKKRFLFGMTVLEGLFLFNKLPVTQHIRLGIKVKVLVF